MSNGEAASLVLAFDLTAPHISWDRRVYNIVRIKYYCYISTYIIPPFYLSNCGSHWGADNNVDKAGIWSAMHACTQRSTKLAWMPHCDREGIGNMQVVKEPYPTTITQYFQAYMCMVLPPKLKHKSVERTSCRNKATTSSSYKNLI
jgi:hypothetical protein